MELLYAIRNPQKLSRSQSRAQPWHCTSFALPAVKEGEVFSTDSTPSVSTGKPSTNSTPSSGLYTKSECKRNTDPGLFAFHLVPICESADSNPAAVSDGKTHQFAIKNKDERIDWMRALMLPRAEV